MSKSSDRIARRIVVGVDGSPSSVAALRWAVAEAELTGDIVEAIDRVTGPECTVTVPELTRRRPVPGTNDPDSRDAVLWPNRHGQAILVICEQKYARPWIKEEKCQES